MAGFFGLFDFTKPGPGVPKDAPKKPDVVIFFAVFMRKFWNLVKLNMLFFLFNLPALFVGIFLSMYIIEGNPTNNVISDFIFKFAIGAILLCIPIITVGPAYAGFTYVLRNYSREEHAFIWWDFKEHSLKNLKEGLVISFINVLVVAFVGLDIKIYNQITENNFWLSLAKGALMIGFLTFLMMQLYIYPMLVTFKLTLKQIYKNALIFAIVRFIPNFGILVLCASIVYATFMFNVLVGFTLLPLITISTIGLIINFFVNPFIKKHMIDKLNNQESTSQIEENVSL